MFNKIIEGVAVENSCFLADFRGLSKYIIDTVHMNHDGYRAMAEIWYQAMKIEGVGP